MGDSITRGLAHTLRCWLVFPSTHACQFLTEPTGCSKEKMARAASGITDTNGKQGLFRLARARCQTITDNRLKGGLNKFVDQFRRRIVRTRRLALRADNELELRPAGSIVVHCGMKFE